LEDQTFDTVLEL
jgi:hypothetical protein